jgi:rSAM/selenodomain-associated transferase 1
VFPTIAPPPNRLLIFARLPELGAVKTRLAREVGDERALAAYQTMLRELLASVGESNAETEIEVMWAPTPAANGRALVASFGNLAVAMQTGETLGDRLAMSFSERFFFHHTQKIVAIGVDEPSLSREMLDRAFAVLDSCDWVIGPAIDGGYYLIGCRAAAFDNEVFQEIEWGGSTVFTATMSKVRRWEHNIAVLPQRRDIDTADDLRAYEAGR